MVALAQAAVAPLAGKDFARHLRRAEAVRNVVGILTLEAVGRVPLIAAEPFALVAAVGAFEAVDALVMLEPLHDAVAVLLAAGAGAAPYGPVLRIGMPI